MKSLTASDRSALVRLAASLPVGDENRRAILAGLQAVRGDNAKITRASTRYAAASAKLDRALKSAVNSDLLQSGFDGTFMWPRLGQALNEIGEVLAKNGISHDTMSADRFRGNDGQATLDIEFTNEADPFSPTPITNSMLVVTYHEFKETGRWEVVAYLS